MKSLNVILIAAAFAMTTACTETEQVLPTTVSQQTTLSWKSSPADQDLPVAVSPLAKKYPGTANLNSTDCDNYGEILVASTSSCRTVIQGSDGNLYEVANQVDPTAGLGLENGTQVVFGFRLSDDPSLTCGNGEPIELTCFRFQK